MRKIIFISWLLAAFATSGCMNGTAKKAAGTDSDSNTTGKSEIAFREYQHDFGKVTEGEKLSYVFKFDNKGTSDLIVSSATTTCGCTVPKYDRKPISPGTDGSLEVVFNTSGRSGTQTKVITVKSNASTPVVLLKITAEVINTSN